jgi:hypothetical protein
VLQLPTTVHAQVLASLRDAQAALDAAPAVSLRLVCARNAAVVAALEAGVPVRLVQRSTGLRGAALELAVARGRYWAEAGPRSLAPTAAPR